MDNKEKKYLFDIQSGILNIENYVGEPKVYEYFEQNEILQDAVERNLE